MTRFEGHRSIVVIKEDLKEVNKTLTFQNVIADKIVSIIKKINTKSLRNLLT